MYKYKRNGFTLVELMAVIIIISLITLLTFPNIINQIKKTKKSNNKMIEDVVIEQAKKYVNDNEDEFQEQKYCFSIDTLVDNNYIKEEIFKNSDVLDKKVIYITNLNADDYKYKMMDKDKCSIYDFVDNDGNGYNEVEYIQATGEQYLDTEYVFKIKPKVVGDIMIMDMSNLDIMGNVEEKTGCFIINVDNSSLFYRYSSSSSIRYDLNLETNKWYNFEFSDKVIVDGVEERTITSYDFSNNTQSFFIARGRGDRGYGKVRFKEIKMYDGDELVRDLVPCYRDRDNKPGMFDVVNKKFYSSETNNDFIQPSDDGGIEIQYIETTGNQYIDTGYVFKNKPKVTGDIMIMDMSNLDIMGNAEAKTGCFIINVDNSSLFYRYSSSSSIRYDLNLETNKWYNFEFSDKVIVDGVEEGTITSYDFSNNTQSFFIARGRGDRVYGKVRFKEIKMYDGDELVRDLVPYYKMDINKVGMLDKVHNVFYENKGTGEFLWG